jgi:hypothetical protein
MNRSQIIIISMYIIVNANNECVEKCESIKCLICGAQGHKLGNFCLIFSCYLLITYGPIIALLVFAYYIDSIMLY